MPTELKLVEVGTEAEQVCIACSVSKPLSEFRVYKAGDGRIRTRKRCSICLEAAHKRWVENNKDQSQKLTRKHHLGQFKLSIPDWERMFAAQNGVCLICRKPEVARDNNNAGKIRRLSIDHDHETGKVRGLLCAKHNSALGLFQDDPVLLRAAADYLEKSRLA
jgi:Recombination endonuclease VII